MVRPKREAARIDMAILKLIDEAPMAQTAIMYAVGMSWQMICRYRQRLSDASIITIKGTSWSITPKGKDYLDLLKTMYPNGKKFFSSTG